jgi:hypothetical protein
MIATLLIAVAFFSLAVVFMALTLHFSKYKQRGGCHCGHQEVCEDHSRKSC